MSFIRKFLKLSWGVEKTDSSVAGNANEFIDATYADSELVIGLVGPVGTNLKDISRLVRERMAFYNYSCCDVRVSKEIIKEVYKGNLSGQGEYEKINSYMDAGNSLRKKYKDNSFLALAAAAKINQLRTDEYGDNELGRMPKKAFIIQSLKHPEEVQRLRNIYASGFYLIGVHATDHRREKYLTENLRMTPEQAKELMARDHKEPLKYGQQTSETFHLSDFFISCDGNQDNLQHDVWRILDLIFGKPFVTPTFDEFAMFMAFSASLRSADLSRQVGAVIANGNNIIATGANDVPAFGGGLYWPSRNSATGEIEDFDGGRDYKRGFDSNAVEKKKIIDNVVASVRDDIRDEVEEALRKSNLGDITEYGRVVHAEMEALMSCSRTNVSSVGATLYCTTFPCHNCAKHIIAAGIKRVVYVEPYPKSKAVQFHFESIKASGKKEDVASEEAVIFEPFIGVGPRNYFNLFSMNLGGGYPLERKQGDGKVALWREDAARLRMQLLPCSYIERETWATNRVREYLEMENEQP